MPPFTPPVAHVPLTTLTSEQKPAFVLSVRSNLPGVLLHPQTNKQVSSFWAFPFSKPCIFHLEKKKPLNVLFVRPGLFQNLGANLPDNAVWNATYNQILWKSATEWIPLQKLQSVVSFDKATMLWKSFLPDAPCWTACVTAYRLRAPLRHVVLFLSSQTLEALKEKHNQP